MYKLIKETLIKRTANRNSYKDWERFVVYICDKKLNLPYSFYTDNQEWNKRRREEDIKKFEKMIQKFEKEENKRIDKELSILFGAVK